MLHTYKAYLFGKFEVINDDKLLPGLERHKVQELFSYLLLYRFRPHLRESLASLMWECNSAQQGKKYLRKALWQLQTTLSTCLEGKESSPIIADNEWIQFNRQTNFWLDVAIFEEAYQASFETPGHLLNRPQVTALQTAINLYTGELLEGWYQDWCIYERTRLQNILLAMLNKLIVYAESHGLYEMGQGYAMRVLQYDLAHEKTHRALMRLFYLSGNRTAALRQFEQCKAILRRELNVEPTELTQTLYKQICQDQLEMRLAGFQTAPAEDTPALSQFAHSIRNLKQLESQLETIQHRIQDELNTLADLLPDKSLPPPTLPAHQNKDLNV